MDKSSYRSAGLHHDECHFKTHKFVTLN